MSSDIDQDKIKPGNLHFKNHLVFHKLTNQFTFGVNNYSPKRFEKLCKKIMVWGYDLNNSEIQISFDDGYKHLVDPVLKFVEEYDLKPIIFIPTAYIGKNNSWDYSYYFRKTPHMDEKDIRKLSEKGVIFGSHGHNHTALTELHPDRIIEELSYSKSILEDITGKSIEMLSYPFGRWNNRIIENANEIGYKYGFTMNFPTENENKLSMGRYPVYGYDCLYTIKQKLNHGKMFAIERAKARFTNRLSGGTIILNRFRRQKSEN